MMLYFLFDSAARKESMKTTFKLLLTLCTISFVANKATRSIKFLFSQGHLITSLTTHQFSPVKFLDLEITLMAFNINIKNQITN
jgi:hypothetical protein